VCKNAHILKVEKSKEKYNHFSSSRKEMLCGNYAVAMWVLSFGFYFKN